jgi:hypothetical protein
MGRDGKGFGIWEVRMEHELHSSTKVIKLLSGSLTRFIIYFFCLLVYSNSIENGRFKDIYFRFMVKGLRSGDFVNRRIRELVVYPGSGEDATLWGKPDACCHPS